MGSREKHILGLDALRFLAALLVVVWHYTFWAWTGAVTEPPPRTVVPFPELGAWTFYGCVGVEIFFLISGFVIAASAEGASAWRFLRSRALRLLPVLWLCAGIALLVRILAGEAAGDLLLPFAASVLILPKGPYIDGVIWTLAVEAVFYGIVFLMLAAGSFRHGGMLCGLLAAWSAGFWAAMAAIEFMGGDWSRTLGQLNWPATILLLKHGCFFAAGIGLWLGFRSGFGPRQSVPLGISVLTSVLAIWLTYGERLQSAVPVFIWLAAFAFVAASVAWNARLMRVLHPWAGTLRLIGLMTYPVYLIHYVPGMVMIGALVDLGLQRHLALGVTISAVLLASYLIVTIAEPRGRAWLAACLDRAEAALPRHLLALRGRLPG